MINRYIMLVSLTATILIPSEWVSNKTSYVDEPILELISSDINNTIIEFELDDFYLENVVINGNNYNIVKVKNGASNLNLGMPDLSHISRSIIIPDNANMNIEIVEDEYIEYNNVLVAPS